jgi:hypothetical protein
MRNKADGRSQTAAAVGPVPLMSHFTRYGTSSWRGRRSCPEHLGVLAGDAARALTAHQARRPPAWATAGAGIKLRVGLLLGNAVASRLTSSSHRTWAMSSESPAAKPLPGADAFARLALVKAEPARRRARVMIGGAACRGRYGPGWQSPVSPYKLGNRLRLATVPPLGTPDLCCVLQLLPAPVRSGTQQCAGPGAACRLVAPRRH